MQQIHTKKKQKNTLSLHIKKEWRQDKEINKQNKVKIQLPCKIKENNTVHTKKTNMIKMEQRQQQQEIKIL